MFGVISAFWVKQAKTTVLIALMLFVCLTLTVQAKLSAENTPATRNTESTSLVLVVANNNPINSLTKKEIIDIFMGRYKTFPDSRLAIAIDYPAGSDIKQNFYRLLVDKSERKINAYWSRLLFSGRATPPKSTNSPQEVVSELINNSNSLAYMPAHAVTSEMKIVYRL